MTGEVYIGLDYGDKSVGVALSSPNGRTALGHTTIRRKDPQAFKPLMKELRGVIRSNRVTHIVLGMPYLMDKGEGQRAEATLFFKDKLEKHFKNKPVILWDERLSTKAVARALGNKKKIDEMAAVYILQGFLDKKDTEVRMDEKTFNEDGTIIMVDENGEEHAVEILVAKECEEGMFAIVQAEDEAEDGVDIVKFVAIDEDSEDFDIEIVDELHEDYKKALVLFKKDIEELGIEVEVE